MVAAGGQTVFAYPFPIYANTDLRVYQRAAATAPNDLLQILTYVANYTVTNNVAPAVGGTITLNVGATVGDIITIIRNMPENRLVNYLDGGLWSATQFNTDFDRTVMMAQTNTMFERVIAPHYNTNDVINTNSNALSSGVDTYLPVLPANCVWMKNNANTAIVPVAIANAGGTGATVILPTVPTSIATFNNTTGTLQSSLAFVDAFGNLQAGVVNALGGFIAHSGTPVVFNNPADTFHVQFSAPALVQSSAYTLPLNPPSIDSAALTTTAAGVMSWNLTTIISTATLSNAQILGMFAAPVIISGSPGVGYAWIVKSIYLEIVFNTAAFANGGVIVAQYGNAAAGAGTNVISNATANTFAAAFFTGAAANQFQALFTNTNIPTTLPANYTNQGVYLSNQTAAFTNAAGGLSTGFYAVELVKVTMV